MGSDESHFNVSVGSDGQSHKTASTDHNLFEEKGEPKRVSNRGPSAYQPNALPLGQTGSRGRMWLREFFIALLLLSPLQPVPFLALLTASVVCAVLCLTLGIDSSPVPLALHRPPLYPPPRPARKTTTSSPTTGNSKQRETVTNCRMLTRHHRKNSNNRASRTRKGARAHAHTHTHARTRTHAHTQALSSELLKN